MPPMVRFRPGTPADSRLAYDIFIPTIDDLGRRTGGGANSDRDATRHGRGTCAARCSTTWPRPATRWWFAEDETTGQAIGYARSIVRDGVRELTEFFVLPEAQGAGVGRGLLERAFPADGARHRAIVATHRPAGDRPLPQAGLDGRVADGVRRGSTAADQPADRPRARADRPGAPPSTPRRHRPGDARLPSRRGPRLAGVAATGLAVRAGRRGRGLWLPPDRAVVGRAVRRARRGRPAGPPGRCRDGRRRGRPRDGRVRPGAHGPDRAATTCCHAASGSIRS